MLTLKEGFVYKVQERPLETRSIESILYGYEGPQNSEDEDEYSEEEEDSEEEEEETIEEELV